MLIYYANIKFFDDFNDFVICILKIVSDNLKKYIFAFATVFVLLEQVKIHKLLISLK